METKILGLDLCANCERDIGDESFHVVNDEVNWCCECFHQKYDTCENCDNDFEHEDMMIVVTKDDNSEHYCQGCYDDLKEQGEI